MFFIIFPLHLSFGFYTSLLPPIMNEMLPCDGAETRETFVIVCWCRITCVFTAFSFPSWEPKASYLSHATMLTTIRPAWVAVQCHYNPFPIHFLFNVESSHMYVFTPVVNGPSGSSKAAETSSNTNIYGKLLLLYYLQTLIYKFMDFFHFHSFIYGYLYVFTLFWWPFYINPGRLSCTHPLTSFQLAPSYRFILPSPRFHLQCDSSCGSEWWQMEIRQWVSLLCTATHREVMDLNLLWHADLRTSSLIRLLWEYYRRRVQAHHHQHRHATRLLNLNNMIDRNYWMDFQSDYHFRIILSFREKLISLSGGFNWTLYSFVFNFYHSIFHFFFCNFSQLYRKI